MLLKVKWLLLEDLIWAYRLNIQRLTGFVVLNIVGFGFCVIVGLGEDVVHTFLGSERVW